jgi:regulator of replication initiation timing
MDKNLHETTVETLQQRLLEEIDAQDRLQQELKTALEHEKDLRLENELLWVYLHKKYPERVEDAAELLERLTAGSDLATEMQERTGVPPKESRTMVQRTRSAVGKLPGVRRAYHGLKNLGK